jgi:hypothetical protein
VLVDNLVSPSHIVFLVPQHASVAGCMLRVTYMTQTSSLRHVHVLNSVHRCFMLDTMNTGAQPSVTLFDFVGVRTSVFATLWRRGQREPSNGQNSPGPCRMAVCVRAAADSWAAPASRAVMRQKPNPPCRSGVGRAGHPLGSLQHADSA